MRSLVKADSFDDEIWLLEHDAVFTLGTAADPSHVLNPGKYPNHSNRQGWRGYFSWSRAIGYLFSFGH